MSGFFSKNARELGSTVPETPLKLPWNIFETPLYLPQNIIEPSLKYTLNFFEIPLKHPLAENIDDKKR